MSEPITGRSLSPDDVLIEAIAERRKDKAFMARLAARIEADAPLLLRLSGHSECQTARLVESRNGGALLVYECECGPPTFEDILCDPTSQMDREGMVLRSILEYQNATTGTACACGKCRTCVKGEHGV